MKLTLDQARMIVLKHLPNGTEVASAVEYDGLYLFIAYRPDPLEGRFDPFFSVNPETGHFRDFSPSDYPEPQIVVGALTAAIKETL